MTAVQPSVSTVYRDRRGTILHLGATIGQGGEAIIYEVMERPDMAAKIYRATPADYALKLTWMIAHPPINPASHQDMTWPVDLVFDTAGTLKGFLMPRIRGGVPVVTVFNPRQREKVIPNFDRRYRYRAARNLSAAVQSAHDAGYVIGDLNESNVLVTATALVVLLDTDSFQVVVPRSGGTRVFRSPVGKPEYTAPELQGLSFGETDRVIAHDLFALGVLVFQLLMEGNHPYRHLWKGPGDPPMLEVSMRNGWFPYHAAPKTVAPPPGVPGLNSLDPPLAALVKRCFVDGHRYPERRPTATEWHRALVTAEANLRACDRGHFYPGHLKKCPDCEALARATRPAPAGKPRRLKKAKNKPPVAAIPPAPPPATVAPAPQPPRGPMPSPARGGPTPKRYRLVRWLFIIVAIIWWWNAINNEAGRAPEQASDSVTATIAAPEWEPTAGREFGLPSTE